MKNRSLLSVVLQAALGHGVGRLPPAERSAEALGPAGALLTVHTPGAQRQC